MCKTITWGTTNSPFPEIKQAFEELHKKPVPPPKQEGTYRYVTNFMTQLYHKLVGETPLEGDQEGSDRYAPNLMAQLHQKLVGEVNLEERKRFLLELGSKFGSSKQLRSGRFTPIHQVLSLYLKERSNQVHSEMEQWALIIDQDIREDLLKHRIPSDFEPRFNDKVFGVHYYEIVKGVLAKESIFTNPVGVDGHAQYEQAHPGFGEVTALLNFGRDPFDDLRKKVTASKSQWIASLKRRYHAEILCEVFKERLNLLFKQDKDRYTDIRLALAQNVRKLLGEDKISLEQAKNLIEGKLIDFDEELCIPLAFKDNGVIFFLQTFGFFEAGNEIVPGKSQLELLNTYAPNN
ncbi:MAG: hypothetical protein JSR80_04600 [Verrucomicrobia bacterium]|nr:hypothetical protein [Verrucomicrobiota bacterium]